MCTFRKAYFLDPTDRAFFADLAELTPLLTEDNLVNEVFVTVSVVPLVAQINAITAEAGRKINALEADSKEKRQVNTDAVAQARE